jgi:hypothetical protein
MQRLRQMIDQGLLDQRRFITIGDVTGARYADIEDLFTEGDYLALFSGATGRKVKVKDLPPGDRIVKRIAELSGGVDFDTAALRTICSATVIGSAPALAPLRLTVSRNCSSGLTRR